MQVRLSHSLTELSKYNVELYSNLESQTGLVVPGAGAFQRRADLEHARVAAGQLAAKPFVLSMMLRSGSPLR